MSRSPHMTAGLSTAAYTLLFRAVTSSERFQGDLRTKIKAISAIHSTATTLCSFYLLVFGEWPVEISDLGESQPLLNSKGGKPDDSTNPIIAGRNGLANALTSWETGYLIYDVGALLAETRSKYNTKGLTATSTMLAKRSPVFLAHHVALISALLYLQQYIANGREKGVWVIIAMLAMNASNPLLHLRWWLTKTTGRVSNKVNIALAAVFALSRFGNVYWILQKYGSYHGVGALEACSKLRVQCITGTGILTGLNAIWWIGLVTDIVKTATRPTVRA